MKMMSIEKAQEAQRKASERAIKIHDALDVPYITNRDGDTVEMLHGKVLRVIVRNGKCVSDHSD